MCITIEKTLLIDEGVVTWLCTVVNVCTIILPLSSFIVILSSKFTVKHLYLF